MGKEVSGGGGEFPQLWFSAVESPPACVGHPWVCVQDGWAGWHII